MKTMAASDRLFIGLQSAGITYSDRGREQDGDYKRVACLSYSTLELEVHDSKSPLLGAVKAHAATLQARAGEYLEVTASGQTRLLGSALTKAG